ncbi:OHCU decarboxylase [Octadecabacter temperatus]|uniref:Chitooligosaccharide deacetylase n=1 Tax=Octadecabacter temperatus TaxID=1458307 RepID=A0A0K0Y214_9RHOB|nr:allantoinase PuuE [Octadecabacter temperatus]AKS44975.1 Uric acid degradation bifunctional protein PucL [Octadecabacter temperatus]SIN83711.1 OHCU decarboxylase [Octadecabacter temperatus]
MTDRNAYPRDLTGYGATPPAANWPDDARIAVQIVLNYEEGGENNILHGDAASEAFLSEIVGAAAWPDQRHANMESIYEYGARAGFWRLHRILNHLPVTVYGVATALARAPEQVKAMLEAGWEVASHGLKWVEHKDMPEVDERAQIAEAVQLHTEVTGSRPRGWYTGRSSENTIRLAAEEGGFKYIADSYADDVPYWLEFGDHDQLIVPYTLDCNDMRFATPQGFNSGTQFFDYLKATFDVLYAEGGRMMSLGLHCRLVGRPGRAQALQDFIAYANSFDGVWFATREEIADHWAAQNPAKRWDRPSQMKEADFVSTFGSIFEHSPWIAERAYALGLGVTHDSATGVHSALCRIFRSASRDERLSVLIAHPDLAGRLAAAGRLTAESTSEQAGVGLDALTDGERETFQALNTQYVEKHGFPFIIAVRDNDKASILAAFYTRIGHDTETEFATACAQVERIAEHRLMDHFT